MKLQCPGCGCEFPGPDRCPDCGYELVSAKYRYVMLATLVAVGAVIVGVMAYTSGVGTPAR